MAKGKGKAVHSFSLDDDVFEELDRRADEHDRSNSGEVNYILRAHLFGGKK